MVSFPVLCSLVDQYQGEELKQAVRRAREELIPNSKVARMRSSSPNSSIISASVRGPIARMRQVTGSLRPS